MKFLFFFTYGLSIKVPSPLWGGLGRGCKSNGSSKGKFFSNSPPLSLPTRGGGTKAQTLLEYLILIGIVTVVLFAMYHAVKRGIQSVIKISADQIGNQQRADQREPNISNAAIVPGPNDQQPVAVSGYLVESFSATRGSNQKEVQERFGDVGYFYSESVSTNSNSLTNLGFNPRGGN